MEKMKILYFLHWVLSKIQQCESDITGTTARILVCTSPAAACDYPCTWLYVRFTLRRRPANNWICWALSFAWGDSSALKPRRAKRLPQDFDHEFDGVSRRLEDSALATLKRRHTKLSESAKVTKVIRSASLRRIAEFCSVPSAKT
jgi:hypothetical protein